MKVFLIAIIIGLTGYTSCEKTDDVEITWVKMTIRGDPVNSYVSYGYSSGVLDSWTWHKNFIVSGDESGDIKITASGPDNKETLKKFVESGITYEISVKGNASSKDTDSDIFLESPSFETIKIVTTDFKTSILEIKIEEAD